MSDTTSDQQHDAARGVLVGGAVGDALGAPLEWMDPARIRAAYGGPVSRFVGGGWLNVRPGQYTDDGQMAIALARSIRDAGRYEAEAALRAYLAWLATGPIDVGATIGSNLRAIGAGEGVLAATRAQHERSGGRSAGNGGLMRVWPLAVRYADPAVLSLAAAQDTSLTHYDPLAAEASAVYCRMVAHYVHGTPMPTADEVEHELLAQALGADRREAEAGVHAAVGFAGTAFRLAVVAVRTATDFAEGLTWVVNQGGDADTNGAIAGALLGARFGHSGIPVHLSGGVEDAGEWVALADALLAASADADASFALLPEERPGPGDETDQRLYELPASFSIVVDGDIGQQERLADLLDEAVERFADEFPDVPVGVCDERATTEGFLPTPFDTSPGALA